MTAELKPIMGMRESVEDLNGLHSLDFPYLYQSRPAWDITVIVLSLGGCLLSCTAVWLAWRRVMRGVKWRRFHAPRWRPARIVSE